jgi:uncharacterized protein YfaA (DUF2138 family)
MSHTPKYQISTASMLSRFEKLHVEKGDVLVVRDMETLRYLSQVKVPGLDGIVPLVFAPQGIQKLTREDLLNLLEQLEQQVTAPPETFESPTAPL